MKIRDDFNFEIIYKKINENRPPFFIEKKKLTQVLRYISKTFYSQATAQDAPGAASAKKAKDAATESF